MCHWCAPQVCCARTRSCDCVRLVRWLVSAGTLPASFMVVAFEYNVERCRAGIQSVMGCTVLPRSAWAVPACARHRGAPQVCCERTRSCGGVCTHRRACGMPPQRHCRPASPLWRPSKMWSATALAHNLLCVSQIDRPQHGHCLFVRATGATIELLSAHLLMLLCMPCLMGVWVASAATLLATLPVADNAQPPPKRLAPAAASAASSDMLMCKRGPLALRVTAQGPNVGRSYYTCPLRRDDPDRCQGAFVWFAAMPAGKAICQRHAAAGGYSASASSRATSCSAPRPPGVAVKAAQGVLALHNRPVQDAAGTLC